MYGGFLTPGYDYPDLDYLERMEAKWDAEDEIAEQRAERQRQEDW